MKNLLALLVITASSTCFANSTCLLGTLTSGDGQDNFGRIVVACNAGNTDSHTSRTAGDTATYGEIATVLNTLTTKGYKVVTAVAINGWPSYTLSK